MRPKRISIIQPVSSAFDLKRQPKKFPNFTPSVESIKVITPMKEGRPFEAAISDKLRRLSWITLIGGGVLSVAKMAGEIILYRVYDLGTVFLNENISIYKIHT